MKKHITIAALLVAGTSLANAGTANFTFNNTIDGAETISVGLGSTGDVIVNLDDISPNAKFTVSQGNEKWFSIAGDVFSDYYFAMKGLDSAGLKEISSVSGVSIDALKNISQGIGCAHSLGSQTLSFTGLEANTEYAIATIFGFAASSSWKMNVSEGEFLSGDFGNISYTNATSQWDPFSGSLPVAAGSGAFAISLTVRTDENGSFSFNTSGPSEIAFVSVSAIPEPSAFGMLAGVGALALAVSRRRRK